jgi:hypothetical protein
VIVVADADKTEVGTAYVTVIPSARGFARSLQKEIAKEFANSDLDKAISEALGSRQIRLPVQVDLDVSALNERALAGRSIRLPVQADHGQAAAEGREAARVAERAAPPVRLRVDVDRGAGGLLAGALSGLASAGSALTGVVSRATSSITGLVTSLVALGGGAALAVPSVYALGGALGSLPALIAGAAAGFGALSLGLFGVADAFKQTASGGGGVARSALQLLTAERAVTRAVRDAAEAQEALNRARQTAARRIRDLTRDVAGAKLDEEAAVLAVREAEAELNKARAGGNQNGIARADLAYRQAVQTLAEVQDRVKDLTVEQTDATRKGVEGSDEVRDALRRQEEATWRVQEAQMALREAQKPPAGGGVAAEVTKLAPAAERFVAAVKSLKPAFEQLRLSVQQKLFTGLDVTIKRLATAWFPQLTKTLGSYATTFNGLLRQAGRSLTQRSFIDNISAGAESARKALQRVGRAVAGPLVDAFGRLARAAGPFVERLGDEVGQLLEDFSAWIAQADKTGALEGFFTRASDILSDLFDMGRDIASIFGSIMSILFGEQDVTNSPWQSLKETLDGLAAWFKDPENQQKVKNFLAEVKKFLTEDLPAAIRTAKGVIDTVDGWIDTVEQWRQRIVSWRDAVVGAFSRVRDGVTGAVGAAARAAASLPGRILSAIGDLGTLLYQAGRNVITGLINGLRSRLGDLRNAVGQVAQLIRDYFPFSPAKTGPLSGSGNPYYSGQSIVRLLSTGVTDSLGSAERAAADLVSTFALAGGPPVAGHGLAAAATSVPGQVTIAFGGDAPDSFMRWVRENTRIYYGGSAQAAIGTGGG